MDDGMTWRKSSYSAQGACVEVVIPTWRKSSRSQGNGQCVEMLEVSDAVLMRDSKDPDGAVLSFRPASWKGFIDAIRAGEFDE